MNIKLNIYILFALVFISVNSFCQSEQNFNYKNENVDSLDVPILVSPLDNDTLGVNDTALVWHRVPGANSYRVLIAIYYTITIIDTTVAGDTSLSIRNLIGTKIRIGWQYYWHVSASDSDSQSPYSSVWSFTAFQIQKFIPGVSWYDADNKIINAHGGGFLYDDSSGTYYWYGEARPVSGYYSTGVSCYSSKNFYNWKFEGIVLSDSSTNSSGKTPVLERPKVIYNDSTKKYVMWMHIDYSDYSLANAGVAVSNNPTGPFKYLGNSRPNNAMSRDMTLFKDDDGKAYLFSSSENNATMYVSLLTGDYLHQSGTYKRNLISQSREAPAVFKYNSKYFMISSGTTGWAPNEARYAVADSPLGPWTLMGNPCSGPNADITFGGQSTFVLPVKGKPGKFIFMADKWNSGNLISSTYIWLPLEVEDNKPVISWYTSWELSAFDYIVGIQHTALTNPEVASLSQNYPNPFNPVTRIKYTIPAETGHATSLHTLITVYDILGREVAILINERKPPGEYEVTFDASNLPSGIYFYRIQSGGYSMTKKMILLK